ncbi:MAG: PEP-CTERM sorting domain-containing protein [Syntrophales bacterium]
MKRILISFAFVFTVLALAATGPALATSIYYTSWESTPTQGEGGSISPTVTPFLWTVVSGSTAAVMNPSDLWFTHGTPYANGVPDGVSDMYIGQGTLYKDVATIIANTTYILTFYVGCRMGGDRDFVKNYTVSLYDISKNTALASIEHTVTGYTPGGPAPNPTRDTWVMGTITFTSTAGMAGDSLRIILSNIGGGNGEVISFDKINLDAAPVPLPSTPLLLGSGLLGLAGWRRFRKS